MIMAAETPLVVKCDERLLEMADQKHLATELQQAIA
jgi:hypothetical protein